MGLAKQRVKYPTERLRGLPPSPFSYIQDQFAQTFCSPKRVATYLQVFRDSVVATKEMMSKPFFGNPPYIEAKRQLLSDLNRAISAGNYSFVTWYQLSAANLRLLSAGPYEELDRHPNATNIEREILAKIILYLGHDMTHISPRSILFYGIEDLEMLIAKEEMFRPDGVLPDIPEFARGHFNSFADGIERFFDYFEGQMGIGEAFFTPLNQLHSLPQLHGYQLKDFTKIIAQAFALRFLGSFFTVTTERVSGELNQHTVEIAVDPSLADIKLPLYLLGPKIVGDMKNCLRIVHNRERALFSHDRDDPNRGFALVKQSRGEPVENPVLVKYEAKRLTSKVWELRISDNGRGIVVEELFGPLIKAYEQMPGAISPALAGAVKKWQAGDPFAFNNIPLGDLFEAVYHLGVSTGTGGKGSGMGLWGSLLMLFKLGAKLRVGISPNTGGFYESIVLPINLTVPHQEVARVAKAIWTIYPE